MKNKRIQVNNRMCNWYEDIACYEFNETAWDMTTWDHYCHEISVGLSERQYIKLNR